MVIAYRVLVLLLLIFVLSSELSFGETMPPPNFGQEIRVHNVVANFDGEVKAYRAPKADSCTERTCRFPAIPAPNEPPGNAEGPSDAVMGFQPMTTLGPDPIGTEGSGIVQLSFKAPAGTPWRIWLESEDVPLYFKSCHQRGQEARPRNVEGRTSIAHDYHLVMCYFSPIVPFPAEKLGLYTVFMQIGPNLTSRIVEVRELKEKMADIYKQKEWKVTSRTIEETINVNFSQRAPSPAGSFSTAFGAMGSGDISHGVPKQLVDIAKNNRSRGITALSAADEEGLFVPPKSEFVDKMTGKFLVTSWAEFHSGQKAVTCYPSKRKVTFPDDTEFLFEPIDRYGKFEYEAVIFEYVIGYKGFPAAPSRNQDVLSHFASLITWHENVHVDYYKKYVQAIKAILLEGKLIDRTYARIGTKAHFYSPTTKVFVLYDDQFAATDDAQSACTKFMRANLREEFSELISIGYAFEAGQSGVLKLEPPDKEAHPGGYYYWHQKHHDSVVTKVCGFLPPGGVGPIDATQAPANGDCRDGLVMPPNLQPGNWLILGINGFLPAGALDDLENKLGPNTYQSAVDRHLMWRR